MTRSAFIVRRQMARQMARLTAALTAGTIAVVSSTSAQGARGVGADGPSAPAQRSVRLLLVLSGEEAANGASMGIAEARRAAELLGNAIHATTARVAPGSTASATAAPLLAAGRYDAIVGGETADDCRAMAALAGGRRAVFVNAWCDDDALRDGSAPRCEGSRAVLPVLHIAPSKRMRDAAIASAASTEGTMGAGVNSADASHERRAVAWHPSLERYGAGQVNDRYRLAYKRGMTERAWLGWAAVKLVTEVALRPGSDHLGAALLEPRPLDGHKGRGLRVRGSDGQLLQPLYVIAAGGASTSSIVAEIADPVARDASPRSPVVAQEVRCE